MRLPPISAVLRRINGNQRERVPSFKASQKLLALADAAGISANERAPPVRWPRGTTDVRVFLSNQNDSEVHVLIGSIMLTTDPTFQRWQLPHPRDLIGAFVRANVDFMAIPAELWIARSGDPTRDLSSVSMLHAIMLPQSNANGYRKGTAHMVRSNATTSRASLLIKRALCTLASNVTPLFYAGTQSSVPSPYEGGVEAGNIGALVFVHSFFQSLSRLAGFEKTVAIYTAALERTLVNVLSTIDRLKRTARLHGALPSRERTTVAKATVGATYLTQIIPVRKFMSQGQGRAGTLTLTHLARQVHAVGESVLSQALVSHLTSTLKQTSGGP